MRIQSGLVVVLAGLLLTSTACSSKSDGGGGGGGGSKKEKTSGALEIPPETEGDTSLELAQMNDKIPLRPAMMMGTLAVGLVEPTDLEEFTENKYVWNPAQIPLTQLNKIVCVLSRTGFHLYPNQGKYIAKITLEDCFSLADGGLAQPTGGSVQVKKTSDVLVESAVEDSKIKLKVWFTREKEKSTGGSPATGDDTITWENYKKLSMNYFVQATIGEVPNNDNPFGMIDLRWEMKAIIDGVADAKPYQQGYVTTEKSATDDQRVELNYNQKNWIYVGRECPVGSWAQHRGFVFQDTSSGTYGATYNGRTLIFNGTSTIDEVLEASPGGALSLNVTMTEDAIFPAGTVTFSGATSTVGTSIGNPARGTFSASEGGMNANLEFQLSGNPDPATNDLVMTFDGIKTWTQVKAAFKAATGKSVETYITTGLTSLILPAPTSTVTLANGVNQTPATGIYVQPETGYTAAFKSDIMNGRKLNGFKITFDGIKTIQETINTFMSGGGTLYPQFDSNSSSVLTSSAILPAGTVVTLSGGAGPETDIWATVKEFVATAELDLVTGKPLKGRAHTAEKWSEERVTNYCPATHTWTPQPTSYGLAFHRFDQYPGREEPSDEASKTTYPGRAAVKQFSEYVATAAPTGFDPTATRCEQIGGELANVYKWALFTEGGERINYRTDYQLFAEEAPSQWGDGWISPWGISIWNQSVQDGDSVYTKNADGTKRNFTVVRFNGTLRDSNWLSQTTAQSSGTLVLTCDSLCPAGEMDQTILNNAWDQAYFFTGQKYIFSYTTKELYHDWGQDGTIDAGDDVVKIGSGIQGSFDLRLKDNSNKEYRYSLNTWSSDVGLKEGNDFFTPPKAIKFNTSRVYDNTADAYPGTEAFNTSHNGAALSTLATGGLKFEYGNLCCFDWEAKSGLLDQWGNTAWGTKITFKKGTRLNVDGSAGNGGDPDGTGPIYDGMAILVAPEFTELRPITKTDCSSTLNSDVAGILSSMALPEALPNASDRSISTLIGARSTDTSIPPLVLDGEKMADE